MQEQPTQDSTQKETGDPSITTSTKEPSMKHATKKHMIITVLVALLAGALTGFGGYYLKTSIAEVTTPAETLHPEEGAVQNGDVFGSKDTDTFKDTAEGYLQAGGIDGEGSHSLLRPGGETQTVYLTSSVTDLSELEGMQVKVWGETFKGQKAGWLMDVGRVEVLDTQGTAPTEE
ncbi:MAG: hypothetical protein H6774_01535 [Pseudomonadales bacterium]|nr:hypothetical protein [Candidatus Woesebacteria bacterium]MCB9801750.1 hypothetical protein [Pseudomonadales bacterium]